jgi:pyrroline-5-carboxylate reductase
MAEALIRGLLREGVAAATLQVAEPNTERRAFLQKQYGVAVGADNKALVTACSTVVLAVKPQIVAEVVTAFTPVWSADKLLVSILAGTATATIEELLGGTPRLVRAMPNLPAVVGAGATALAPGRYATNADLLTARRLFSAAGLVQAVTEGQLDAVTGLSGSGPAYVFTVIEALADGGVQEGLPRDVAQALAIQTVLGAAQLVKESGEHTAVLRDRVCSPGGTTIAGVRALEEKGLRAALMEAVASATRRSRELGGKK